MTKREIIYTVFEKLNILTDDTNVSEDLVSSLIDTKRAMLLKQQYATNGWYLPREVKQELCVPLELIDKVDGYSCAGKILASTVTIPRSIRIKGKEGPLNVRLYDGTALAINPVALERLPFLFENKFTQHLTYCSIDFNGKLFLISKDNKHRFLKQIKVTDVFESPDVARELVCGVDSTKEAWDVDYPIESAMADTVVDLVVKDMIRAMAIPVDKDNDAADGRR